MNDNGKHPEVIRDASVESILAEKALDAAMTAPGTMCSYVDLQAALGKNPQGEGYPYVSTARRRFERKHNCVLHAIHNEGIKWMTAEEVARQKWDHDSGHIRRSAKHALRRQKTLLTEEAEKALGPEGIKKRNQNLAFAGVLAMVSKPKVERRIAEAADQSSRVLAASEAAKFFAEGSK